MFMLTAKDNHSAAKRKSRTTKKFWFIGNKLSKKFIMQELYERGAWKFCFIGLGPLGCLPISRALKPNATNNEGCFEELSALALAHNNALSGVLVSLEYILEGFKYVSPNVYDWISDRINHPTRYGTLSNLSQPYYAIL